MSDETTQVEEQNAETAAPAPEITPTPEAAAQAVEAQEPEPRKDVEMVLCMVSKEMVPLEETIELERKKGEVLRLHQRYKKFE